MYYNKMSTLTQSTHYNGNMEPSRTATLVSYATLRTMTTRPSAPMYVMNKFDGPWATQAKAFNQGLLNPNQNTATGGYYNINTAYGKEPVQLYATRGCASNKIVV